jgi:leader peptidase (prepilin peptidase)/N-methyltransferase
MNFWELYWAALIFLLGLCSGSFLNVCIYRIPAEKSVVHPPSSCPRCGMRIKWFDNIPVLSWCLLRARCRGCGAKISARYPLVEALTGVLFLAVWLLHAVAYSQPAVASCYLLAVFGLILGTFVDLDEMWLPDRVTIGGMIIAPVLSFLVPELHDAPTRLLSLKASAIGLAAGFGSLWLVGKAGTAIFKKEAMGFGDVKLMGALGALLGWPAIIFILFFSSLFGSAVGVSLMAAGKKELQSRLPYGPYIALAAIFWMLGGDRIWAAYTAFFTV